jgi:ECF sigma factor
MPPFQCVDFLRNGVCLPLQLDFRLLPVGRIMTGASCKSVSQLLVKWKGGDEEALRALVPLVYPEPRRLAHHYLQGENPGHTLESTALVHEAYLRLAERDPLQFQNRALSFARTHAVFGINHIAAVLPLPFCYNCASCFDTSHSASERWFAFFARDRVSSLRIWHCVSTWPC